MTKHQQMIILCAAQTKPLTALTTFEKSFFALV